MIASVEENVTLRRDFSEIHHSFGLADLNLLSATVSRRVVPFLLLRMTLRNRSHLQDSDRICDSEQTNSKREMAPENVTQSKAFEKGTASSTPSPEEPVVLDSWREYII